MDFLLIYEVYILEYFNLLIFKKLTIHFHLEISNIAYEIIKTSLINVFFY